MELRKHLQMLTTIPFFQNVQVSSGNNGFIIKLLSTIMYRISPNLQPIGISNSNNYQKFCYYCTMPGMNASNISHMELREHLTANAYNDPLLPKHTS
jgi:hypothetical protein